MDSFIFDGDVGHLTWHLAGFRVRKLCVKSHRPL